MKARSLKFKKGADKFDHVEFWIGDKKLVALQNPKQRILPHDMVHYVVETCFPFEGFIKLVFGGHEPGKVIEVLGGFAPQLPQEYSQTSWITESLVESLQASLWSAEVTFDGFKYLFAKACEVRKIPEAALGERDFSQCIELVEDLSSKWEKLKIGETLELNFIPRTLNLTQCT